MKPYSQSTVVSTARPKDAVLNEIDNQREPTFNHMKAEEVEPKVFERDNWQPQKSTSQNDSVSDSGKVFPASDEPLDEKAAACQNSDVTTNMQQFPGTLPASLRPEIRESFEDRMQRVFEYHKKTRIFCPDDYRLCYNKNGELQFEQSKHLNKLIFKKCYEGALSLAASNSSYTIEIMAGAPGTGKSTFINCEGTKERIYIDATLGSKKSVNGIKHDFFKLFNKREIKNSVTINLLYSDLDVLLNINKARPDIKQVPVTVITEMHSFLEGKLLESLKDEFKVNFKVWERCAGDGQPKFMEKQPHGEVGHS